MSKNYTFPFFSVVLILLNIGYANAQTPTALFQQELDTTRVFIRLTPEDVMERVNQNLERNYNADFHKLAVKESGAVKSTLNFCSSDLKKLSGVGDEVHQKINREFEALSSGQTDKSTTNNRHDYRYEMQIGKKDSLKVAMKSALLKCSTDRASPQLSVLKTLFSTLRENLENPNTFKVKSGLLKVEDSLDMDDLLKTPDTVWAKTKRKKIKKLWQKANFRGADNFQFITDYHDYAFAYVGQTKANGKTLAVYRFKPNSRRADYTGTLYIVPGSFAIMGMVFKLAEGKTGKSVNMKFLLGLKSKQKRNSGTYVYQKTGDEHYAPKYIDFTTGDYHYFNRRLKFKENTYASDQIKVKLKVKAEGSDETTCKYLFQDLTKIKQREFGKFTEKDAFLNCENL